MSTTRVGLLRLAVVCRLPACEGLHDARRYNLPSTPITIASILAFPMDIQCKIAVVQYERADYRVGTEEHLHWAIVVQTERLDQDLPCFQVFDRHYSDSRGVQWHLFDRDISLLKMRKCLGGISIGSVKYSRIKALREVISGKGPVPKFPEWNYRYWMIEVIQLFAEQGWISTSILDQATLLPSMRIASVTTKAAYTGSPRPIRVRYQSSSTSQSESPVALTTLGGIRIDWRGPPDTTGPTLLLPHMVGGGQDNKHGFSDSNSPSGS
ncbi:predicted protein [Postia placenta Mad-698-R]|uniref:Uncharacterized protein n=1 Tax=Postia placenta MAD-698-R-SB12 TaxID=670580 RepID=A0A1X6N1R3_9APHY|nr:hypothetical protein POSPLADRAFT_1143298 [Postia placenta MAD-698-R-SB12]EED80291.1 predicted protein [Postia placenta Mad-698-R]OSX62450.1 hypothetical protein POSPLADRAFT_1143298 [Postia placenta MAD-698-R-SB12]